MAQICKLSYDCLDKTTTQIRFYKPTVSNEANDYFDRVLESESYTEVGGWSYEGLNDTTVYSGRFTTNSENSSEVNSIRIHEQSWGGGDRYDELSEIKVDDKIRFGNAEYTVDGITYSNNIFDFNVTIDLTTGQVYVFSTIYYLDTITYGIIEAEQCVTDAINELKFGTSDIEFCGTSSPLTIQWGRGDRYGTSMASAAKLSLLIRTLEERQALESVFNGGWVLEVDKDDEPYWRGKITSTLGIEQYKTYPYALTLNANDGLGETKANQFLTIDFPDPFQDLQMTMIKFITIIIEKFLYPNSDHNIYVASNLYQEFGADDGRQLDRTYLDPLTFMEVDNSQYIATSEVIDSLLGIFNLRMFQWKTDWYVVSLDAQWDGGNISLSKYTSEGVYVSSEYQELGLLDLYSCEFTTDYQLGSSASINFIAPLRQAVLKQNFQMNTNILPAFSNRNANFLKGFDGVTLEFNPAPITNQMRHWTNVNDFNGAPYYDNDNAGYLSVPVDFEDNQQSGRYAYVEYDVNSELQFDTFFFSISSIPTFNNNIDTLTGVYWDGEYKNFGIKRKIKIEYENTVGTVYSFWLNNDVGDFPGWFQGNRIFYWDNNEDISIEAKMPDNLAFTGGKFRMYFYNAYDRVAYGSSFRILYSNIQLGIISSSFKQLPDKEKANNLLTRYVYPLAAELIFAPSAIGAGVVIGREIKEARERNRLKKVRGQIGEDTLVNYRSTEINWENDLVLEVNSDGKSTQNFEYRFGINYQGLKSYHEIHISSAYNSSYDSMERWLDSSQVYKDGGESTVLDLITWRGRQILRDNKEYTTQLSGEWRSPSISPVQIVNDFEGRVYYPTKMVLKDKFASWTNEYMEFKALSNQPNVPIVCDFDPQAFDDSFCKGSGGVPVPGYQYDLGIGNDGVDYGFSDTPPFGSVAPTKFENEWIYYLASKGQDIVELSLGIPTQALLPGVTQVDLYLVSLDETIILYPDVDHYTGIRADIRDYLSANDGETIKITLNPIE